MSDIFDERESIKSTREVVSKMKDWYNQYLSSKPADLDPDISRRRTKLAIKFPDEELVGQIIIDAIDIINSYGIDPRDIKY